MLVAVPPFVTVTLDVSRQLFAMPRWAGLVLAQVTFHEYAVVPVVVIAVVNDVPTVCGDAPATGRVAL